MKLLSQRGLGRAESGKKTPNEVHDSLQQAHCPGPYNPLGQPLPSQLFHQEKLRGLKAAEEGPAFLEQSLPCVM